MENAVDALKIAFAILVFVIALSITFSSISQVKKTGDFILKSVDKTNYYTKLGVENLETYNGGRIVGIDTIISNMYRIKQETFAIKVVNGSERRDFTLDNFTEDELLEQIESFKKEHINSTDEYIETFSEITYSGEYIIGEDGSRITIVPGGTKIYITYTKQSIY